MKNICENFLWKNTITKKVILLDATTDKTWVIS